MVANVAFDLEPKKRLVIPAVALSITDQGNFVFVVKENKAKRTRVQFNVIDNDRIEILEGLNEQDQVITEGTSQVGDDADVKVMEASKES